MTEESNITDSKPENKGLGFALDFGPLLVFFLTYKFAAPGDNPITSAIYGTAAFMVAIIIAVIISKWKMGKVSPMLWMSAILIIGFGALTIYFNDPRFIQHKPTIIYSGFAVILLGGLMRGKAMLKYLLQAAFEGLTDEGWIKLSRNWALFFIAMAAANEIMVATLSFDLWLTIKVWGMTIVSFIFALSNIPMLMRHGFAIEEPAE